MGNRAVITTAPYSPNSIGVYVHWNGGRASVEGFLAAARELGFRSPDGDRSYAFARLAQVIATFFGNDGLSVGIDVVSRLDSDNGDNGTYLIGKDWQIVGRKFFPDYGEEIDPAKTEAIKNAIIAKLNAAEEAKAEEA